jgi:DNA topoisomerase-6 subunit B
VQIDTKKNEPRIFENKIDWENHRGTQVTLEIEGAIRKGASVDEYLEQTAIANPTSRSSIIRRKGK